MEDHKLELQLRLANRRMIELHLELRDILRHARELSEASRRRSMASMGNSLLVLPRVHRGAPSEQ